MKRKKAKTRTKKDQADAQVVIPESATFPSIRAKMGSIEYFVATMTFAEVEKWIMRPTQTQETDSDFKLWLQRKIDKSRLGIIANYLKEHDERFFNSVVVGTFDGDPRWFPVTVENTPQAVDVELDERTKNALGILQLHGGEQTFPIDGQHRVEAIKLAISEDKGVANDELSVIFLTHRTTKVGRQRTRRLFTNLNKYARPVSPGDIVALDEDDAFAIATRKMIEEFEPLSGLVRFSKLANITQDEQVFLTTAVALYRVFELLPRTINKSTRALKSGPANKLGEAIDAVYNRGEQFWNLLAANIPAINQLLGTKPGDKVAGKLRRDGGNILLRPVGQHAFAKASSVLVKSGLSFEDAITKLSRTEQELNRVPWRNVLWDPDNGTMIVNFSLATNLLLYMVDGPPTASNYNVAERYYSATQRDIAEVPCLPDI